MLPDPLHPAIVHFPVVLAMLAPLVAVASLWAIRRGMAPARAWGATSGMLAALALSAWVATATGEREEERVERVVGESALHGHEEGAEVFLYVAAGVLVLGLVGLARGRVGTAGRALATLGTVGLVGIGVNVGHSGGQLVYRHGAAAAYVTPAGGSPSRQPSEERGKDHDDEARSETDGRASNPAG